MLLILMSHENLSLQHSHSSYAPSNCFLFTLSLKMALEKALFSWSESTITVQME